MFYIQEGFFLNPAVYEKLWKNIVESDGPRMTV